MRRNIQPLAQIVVTKGDRMKDSHTQQLSLKSYYTFGCPLRRSVDKALSPVRSKNLLKGQSVGAIKLSTTPHVHKSA